MMGKGLPMSWHPHVSEGDGGDMALWQLPGHRDRGHVAWGLWECRDRGRDLLMGFLLQVGHEPLPPTVGRNVLGRKVLYLPGFFTYGKQMSLPARARSYQKMGLGAAG